MTKSKITNQQAAAYWSEHLRNLFIASYGFQFLILMYAKLQSEEYLIPDLFALSKDTIWSRPWTLFTYPYVLDIASGGLAFVWGLLFYLFCFPRVLKNFIYYRGIKQTIIFYLIAKLLIGIAFLLMVTSFSAFAECPVALLSAYPLFLAFIIATAAYAPETPFLFLFIPIRAKHLALLILFLTLANCINEQLQGLASSLSNLVGVGVGWIYGNLMRKKIKTPQRVKYATPLFTRPKRKFPSKGANKTLADILEKLDNYGYESLTNEEKKRLFDEYK